MKHLYAAKNEHEHAENNSTQSHAINKVPGAISQAGTPSQACVTLYMLIDSFTHT